MAPEPAVSETLVLARRLSGEALMSWWAPGMARPTAGAAGRASPIIVLIFRIGLACAILAAFWRSGMAPHGDAHIYLDAAADTLRGDGPYVTVLKWRAEGYWMGDVRPRPTVADGPYVYPPLLAMVLIPLLALPRDVATYLCYVVGFVAVLATAAMLARFLLGRSLTGFLVIATLMLYFQPIRRNFFFAQVDTVVLALMVLGLLLLTQRRDAWAGLAVAVGVAIKPFAGFVLLYFLWKRAYRAAAALLIGSGLLVGVPLLALGWHTVGEYLAGTSWWVGPQAASTIANQSPSGMLLRAFTSLNGPPDIAEMPWLVLPLRAVVIVGVVAALMWLVSRERDLPSRSTVAEYGAMMAGMILVSPLGEDLHFVYLAVPLLATGLLCAAWWRESLLVQVAGVTVLVLYVVFLTSLHHTMPWDGPFVALCAVAFVGGVALGYDARRRRMARASESPILERTVAY